MPFSLRNFDARMNVDQSLFEPFTIAPDHRIAGIDPRVGLALLDRDINLGSVKSDDKPGIFQTEQIGKEPAGDVNRMADGLAADPHSRRRTKLFQSLQTGEAVRNEQ